MEKDYKMISSLDLTSQKCKLLVRVTRLWEVFDLYNGNKISVDMILLDEQGDQIQATIPHAVFQQISDSVHEGSTLFLEDFKIQQKSKLFWPVDNQYKVLLDQNTVFKPVEVSISFPPQQFTFTNFKEIPYKYQKDHDLIDVIGYWSQLGCVENRSTKLGSASLRDLHIIDNDGNPMRISFWGEMIKQLPSTDNLDWSQERVVIVTSTSVKKHFEKYHLQATFATKVYLDLEHNDVVSFRNMGSKVTEHLAPTPTKRPRVDFENQGEDDKMTITDILSAITNVSSKDFYSCTASITKVYEERGWFYTSCTECMKIVRKRDNKYWCFNCKKFVEHIERYKLQFEIQDGTGSVDIAVFAAVAESLIGRSLDSITNTVNEEKNVRVIYEMIEKDIVGKEYIFNLKISNYNRQNPSSSLTATRITSTKPTTKKGKHVGDAEVAIKKEKEIERVTT